MHTSSPICDMIPCLPVLAGDGTTRKGPDAALASFTPRRPTKQRLEMLHRVRKKGVLARGQNTI